MHGERREKHEGEEAALESSLCFIMRLMNIWHLVKRVQFDELKKTVTLISANTAYAPRKAAGHDLDDFRYTPRTAPAAPVGLPPSP
ncbi:hypothetical protein AGMMS4952_16990 [Spirochaetia bacterium]|nr:hypothetical protein AGMMS4952_16990 [Spirochaetia bacterium]